jgi:ribosome biogenesis protein ENP2
MGPAPKWCSFIENLTEELEEKQTETIYNEYKFLSKEELDKIKSSDLIGTKYLQSYMHGFIMKAKLYNKLKDKAQPFDYNAYKEEQIQAKLNKELSKDKIFNKVQKARVNQKLIEKVQKENEKGLTSSGKAKPNVLEDERFRELIENEEFEKDETNEDYILRNPSAAAQSKKKKAK